MEMETVGKRLLRRGRRSEAKNLCLYVVISCIRELKVSNGRRMRDMASGLHADWNL